MLCSASLSESLSSLDLTSGSLSSYPPRCMNPSIFLMFRSSNLDRRIGLLFNATETVGFSGSSEAKEPLLRQDFREPVDRLDADIDSPSSSCFYTILSMRFSLIVRDIVRGNT